MADQADLAAQLYGDRAARLVGDWLDEQMSFIGNPIFARRFSDHIDLPGVSPLDYAHRHLRTSHGDLLGGIRFRGGDIARPFVDVIAHSFSDITALAACVHAEWPMFASPYLRLLAAPGSIPGHGAVLDQSIHLARYGDLRPPDGRVRLERFDDAEQAIAMLTVVYADIDRREPELAADLPRAADDDVRLWHDNNQLHAVHADGATAGLLAVAPGCIEWITGDEIQEEVIATAHRGHGFAATAQTALATDAVDPEVFLIGTITARNHASRRTALNAGRPRIIDYIFVPTGGPKT